MKVVVSLSLSTGLVDRIDKERGDVPRSTFIQTKLERDCNGGGKKKA